MKYGVISSALLLALGMSGCGGGGGESGGSSSSVSSSPANSSSSSSSSSEPASSASSSSESSSAQSSASSSEAGIWSVYDATYSPFVDGVVELANGETSAFSLGGNDAGKNEVYFSVTGSGSTRLDSTAAPEHYHYGTLSDVVRNDGVYPKYFTLIAGVTGPEDSNRVLDFEVAMADVDQEGTRLKAIIRADDANTGVQLERVIPETDTSADSRQHYGLDMLGVFHIYHFTIELTAPTQGSVRVYVDGNPEPLSDEDPAVSVLIDNASLRRTRSPGENFLRIGDTGGSAYKGVIDWVIWTDEAAFTPEQAAGTLPENIGCVVGYGASDNTQECGLADETPPQTTYQFDLSHWKITLPDGSERNTQWLMDGATSPNEFYYTAEGAMVFRSPNLAGTTANSSYPRSELREMLRGTNTSISTKGVNGNNWVISTSSAEAKAAAGGVDGTLTASLQVDHVSTTGEDAKVGRVIIGQIHASDDEPLRLYYRKLPGNTRGSIYFAHEIRGGDDTWYEMIGSRSSTASDPQDGIALGERFGYTVDVDGQTLTVTIHREGKPDVVEFMQMDSAYEGDWMYFKAGVYNQNNTGSESDYVQATFFELSATHD